MHPHPVDGDGLDDLPPEDRAAGVGQGLIFGDDPLQHPVFQLVVAMRRHGHGGPGVGQGRLQLRQLLPRIAVQHGQYGTGGDDAVVIAAAQRRIEEEMARLLEPGEGPQFGGLALDIAVARLPVDDLGPVRLQHRVGLVQAGRFHIDDEGGVGVQGRQVAAQHQADLVGIDLLARVIHHAAAVTVAVEAQGQIGPGLAHPGRHLHQHGVVFGVRIVFGEGPVEVGVHLDDLGPHPAQGLGRKGTGRAIAAGGHDLDRPAQLHLGGDLFQIAFAEAFDPRQRTARAGHALAIEDDVLEPPDLVGAEGQGRVGPHLDPRPAVLVVAGRDHGHAGCVEGELGEIGRRRQGQTDIQNLHPAFQQAEGQGLFHAQRIGAEIVADHDPRPLADLVHIGRQPEAERLYAQQIDLLLQDPARVVLAEPGRLDQRNGLVFGGVGAQV